MSGCFLCCCLFFKANVKGGGGGVICSLSLGLFFSLPLDIFCPHLLPLEM